MTSCVPAEEPRERAPAEEMKELLPDDQRASAYPISQKGSYAHNRQSAAGRASNEGRRTSFLGDGVNGAESPEKAMKSTFVDANAMKEKVRQNLTKPQHSVKDYYKPGSVFTKIATSSWFDFTTLGIIAFNAIWIAVDTDFNSAELLISAHPVFIAAENLFCSYFFFEWFVRFMSFKRKRDGLKDAWFVFDSFMVFMMVLETWVMTCILLMAGGAGGGTGDASILRVARLLRLSRMARMARLLRALPELMIMIRGMVAATRSVFFTLCLLIIVMYVFGIAFTQLCAETSVGNKYFPSVPHAMFTLLIYGTLLDNIGTVAKELGAEQIYIAAIFFLFVLLAALTVMNMLIGVLCEVVNAVAATEKEEMLVTYVNQKLHRVVHLLDSDGGGTISKKEFMQILENSDAVRCLQDVGVDVIGLVDFAEYIFEDENAVPGDGSEDAEEIELDFGKFMEVVLQLRGTNNATVKDIVDLRKFMRMALLDTNKHLQRICQDNEVIRRRMGVTQGISVIYPDNAALLAQLQQSQSAPQLLGSQSVPLVKPEPVANSNSTKQSAPPYRPAKEPQSSNCSSSSHHIARESDPHHVSRDAEHLALTCTQVEELRDPPKQIVWSSKPWNPDSADSTPPLPVLTSPSVYFLQPPLEDGTGSDDNKPKTGDGLNLRECTPDARLSGQWFPYKAASVQVIDANKAATSILDPAVARYADPFQKAAAAENPEAVIKAPLMQADGNSVPAKAHGYGLSNQLL